VYEYNHDRSITQIGTWSCLHYCNVTLACPLARCNSSPHLHTQHKIIGQLHTTSKVPPPPTTTTPNPHRWTQALVSPRTTAPHPVDEDIPHTFTRPVRPRTLYPGIPIGAPGTQVMQARSHWQHKSGHKRRTGSYVRLVLGSPGRCDESSGTRALVEGSARYTGDVVGRDTGCMGRGQWLWRLRMFGRDEVSWMGLQVVCADDA
jgi:hypothetical protein